MCAIFFTSLANWNSSHIPRFSFSLLLLARYCWRSRARAFDHLCIKFIEHHCSSMPVHCRSLNSFFRARIDEFDSTSNRVLASVWSPPSRLRRTPHPRAAVSEEDRRCVLRVVSLTKQLGMAPLEVCLFLNNDRRAFKQSDYIGLFGNTNRFILSIKARNFEAKAVDHLCRVAINNDKGRA